MTIATFTDLYKAFDSLSQDILIHKLSIYGIIGPPLAWLTDYLRDRQ